jgi:hypothetical protein
VPAARPNDSVPSLGSWLPTHSSQLGGGGDPALSADALAQHGLAQQQQQPSFPALAPQLHTPQLHRPQLRAQQLAAQQLHDQQQQQQLQSSADPVVDPARVLPAYRAGSGALPPIGAGVESHGSSSGSMHQQQQVLFRLLQCAPT